MKVVGLMSGTSADGVDAALVSIVRRGGRPQITPIAFTSMPYPRPLQQRLVELSLHGHVAEICHMNTYLGELFAKAALKVIHAAQCRPADIDAIGQQQAVRDTRRRQTFFLPFSGRRGRCFGDRGQGASNPRRLSRHLGLKR